MTSRMMYYHDVMVGARGESGCERFEAFRRIEGPAGKIRLLQRGKATVVPTRGSAVVAVVDIVFLLVDVRDMP